MAKNKKKRESSTGGDPNLAMTISLFIIILAFFIMLNALAVPDERRKRVALGSLNDSFGVLTGGDSVLDLGPGEISDNTTSNVSRLIDLNEMLTNKDGLASELVVTGNRRRSTLSIPEHRLFRPGEAVLIPESHAILDKLGQIIKKNNYPVDIMGYVDNADSESGQGTAPRELSTLRAAALLAFFINNNQVPPKLLTAYGWGSLRPAASNRTRETRTLNRRMEVVFIHQAKYEEPEGAFTFKDFFFNVFEKKKP
jgi:chemotaxis protein MotB